VSVSLDPAMRSVEIKAFRVDSAESVASLRLQRFVSGMFDLENGKRMTGCGLRPPYLAERYSTILL
jgi:hypothetical protein